MEDQGACVLSLALLLDSRVPAPSIFSGGGSGVSRCATQFQSAAVVVGKLVSVRADLKSLPMALASGDGSWGEPAQGGSVRIRITQC